MTRANSKRKPTVSKAVHKRAVGMLTIRMNHYAEQARYDKRKIEKSPFTYNEHLREQYIEQIGAYQLAVDTLAEAIERLNDTHQH